MSHNYNQLFKGNSLHLLDYWLPFFMIVPKLFLMRWASSLNPLVQIKNNLSIFRKVKIYAHNSSKKGLSPDNPLNTNSMP